VTGVSEFRNPRTSQPHRDPFSRGPSDTLGETEAQRRLLRDRTLSTAGHTLHQEPTVAGHCDPTAGLVGSAHPEVLFVCLCGAGDTTRVTGKCSITQPDPPTPALDSNPDSGTCSLFGLLSLSFPTCTTSLCKLSRHPLTSSPASTHCLPFFLGWLLTPQVHISVSLPGPSPPSGHPPPTLPDPTWTHRNP
jgi:hypothetical protein